MKPDRDWMIDAACRGHGDDMFPNTKDKHGQRHAANICRTCPVQLQCAKYATDTGATHGIWAGQYKNQKTHTSAASYPIKHGTEGGVRAHRRKGEKACDACQTAEWEAKKRRLGAR